MAKSRGKIGSAGRFGERYGKRIKSLTSSLERSKNARYKCPRCSMVYVVRESSGIWKCRKCGNRFAGQAYRPGTKSTEGN